MVIQFSKTSKDTLAILIYIYRQETATQKV